MIAQETSLNKIHPEHSYLQSLESRRGLVSQVHKQKQSTQSEKEVSFFQMLRFATYLDYFLMILGGIASIAVGGGLPAFAYIWGQMNESSPERGDKMVDIARDNMFTYFEMAAGILVAGTLMYGSWMVAGERQAIVCRQTYLKALLRQQIGWFDLQNQTQLASKFASDTLAFQNGIGDKVSTLIMPISALISGFVFAFIKGWRMSLVMITLLPPIGVAAFIFAYTIHNKEKKKEAKYSEAGGRVEQALSSIKTIKQLNGEQYESGKYDECLEETRSSICFDSLCAGAGYASIYAVIFCSFSLGFWYGSKCVINEEPCYTEISDDRYTAGMVVVCFFSIVLGGFSLVSFGPSIEKIIAGKQAAARIFAVIDREPEIKDGSNAIKIQKIQGKIKFENVTFAYPKDKSRKVLDNISLEFDVRKSGLVGESGCGKSTILQLIMRFYDPDEGRITLDGHDLRTLELKWLRENIGYVGQEPVLFAASIRENLLFGKEDASEAELVGALRRAEAYDFVFDLEDKMETFVGMGGGQLSGGQRQRIAIARTLLKNPQILLFDEATSALDRRNERLIQKTLDQISAGHTSITVAHRVRTIMNSDVIHVLDKGKVIESGQFKSLKKYQGHNLDEDKITEETRQRVQENPQQGKQLINEEEQIDNQEEEEKKYEGSIFRRIFSYSADKIVYFISGIIVALANGTIFPVLSLFLSKMLTTLLVLQIFPESQEEIDEVNEYVLAFLYLGIALFILTTLQQGIFNIVGESITFKLRSEVFLKMVKMPIPWFDIPKNNSGTLAARLATDCSLVNGLTTSVVGIILQNISSIITGLVIGLLHDWRTTLVGMGLLPFLILGVFIQLQYQVGKNSSTDQSYKDSSSLIMEALLNIRTVSSAGFDTIFMKKYGDKLKLAQQNLVRRSFISGLTFGFGQFIIYIVLGILFFVGAVFVRDHTEIEVDDMFTAIYAVCFCALALGNNSVFMPDMGSSKNAAANLFQILDGEDEDQMQVREKSELRRNGIKGDIEFRNVCFKYDSRVEKLFTGLSFKIPSGSKAAFVGTSGCGKSTIIQILLRYYFPSDGEVLLNGTNIKDFDIHYLRESFGLVSQEPTLFNGSFRQNIKYNLTKGSNQQITMAALKANALSFIEGSEKLMGNSEEKNNQEKIGFERNVGVKGSHISGGQKQRVAIARAIMRNPEKLLLDEATSALDSENEKKVQHSLDNMMKGKTTISIAHRIDTIKNSDKIFVFEKGKIVEEGNYSTLVSAKGYFYNLERGITFM